MDDDQTLDEEHADSEWVSYKEKISHSTDSGDSIQFRLDFMLRNLLTVFPDLARKDNQRDFTPQQKLAVFRRDNGLCQVRLKCDGVKITWDEWHWLRSGPAGDTPGPLRPVAGKVERFPFDPFTRGESLPTIAGENRPTAGRVPRLVLVVVLVVTVRASGSLPAGINTDGSDPHGEGGDCRHECRHECRHPPLD